MIGRLRRAYRAMRLGTRLALGLARQDPDFVFRRFADELDDPLADLVATGLSIAVRRGLVAAG